VLCYHAVSPRFPAALSVTPDRFRAQLRRLADRGFVGATFAAAARGEAPGRRIVAVTFDDAYRSVLALGRPILDELGWPATVFAPTDHVGSERPMRWPGIEQWHGGPHEDELVPMSWDELRELAGAGWEIGSHTCSHPRLTEVSDEQLADELERSRAIVADRVGRPCDTLAYPYGDVDERVEAAAGRAGYALAATLPKRLARPRSTAWPRVGIYHGDDARRFALKVSPIVRRIRSTRLWENAIR